MNQAASHGKGVLVTVQLLVGGELVFGWALSFAANVASKLGLKKDKNNVSVLVFASFTADVASKLR